jgi:hypothetical protein
MFARSLSRSFRPIIFASPRITSCSTLSKFNSAAITHLHRQRGCFSTLMHVGSSAHVNPRLIGTFSHLQGGSRPSLFAVSKRSFFSSSDGPRPAFSEVISIMKLKVG